MEAKQQAPAHPGKRLPARAAFPDSYAKPQNAGALGARMCTVSGRRVKRTLPRRYAPTNGALSLCTMGSRPRQDASGETGHPASARHGKGIKQSGRYRLVPRRWAGLLDGACGNARNWAANL